MAVQPTAVLAARSHSKLNASNHTNKTSDPSVVHGPAVQLEYADAEHSTPVTIVRVKSVSCS